MANLVRAARLKKRIIAPWRLGLANLGLVVTLAGAVIVGLISVLPVVHLGVPYLSVAPETAAIIPANCNYLTETGWDFVKQGDTLTTIVLIASLLIAAGAIATYMGLRREQVAPAALLMGRGTIYAALLFTALTLVWGRHLEFPPGTLAHLSQTLGLSPTRPFPLPTCDTFGWAAFFPTLGGVVMAIGADLLLIARFRRKTER
jgi:hypothetical protein